MRTILPIGLVSVACGAAAVAQLVPEDVHSEARGPSTMCGITGRDALELIRQVSTSGTHRKVSQSARFEFYLSADERDQWVFTRAGEAAHPAVTCRHIFGDEAGNLYQDRDMRCDASREACDRLFLEFEALDERLRRSFE